MKRMERYCTLITICLFILGPVIAHKNFLYAGDVPGVTDNSIKIGFIFDQTGPAANVVIFATQAVRNYFRHMNEQGGIHGRKVNLLVEDDRYAIPMAIAAFKKLVFKDEVFAIGGPTSTDGTTVLVQSAQKHRVPMIAGVMPEITVRPFKRYVFTIADIYPNQMKVLIDYMLKVRKPTEPTIALIYPDNQFGKVDRESALERLKLYNLVPVSKEVLNPGALDASSQVMSLKRAKTNHLVACGFAPQAAGVLLRDMRKYGLDIPVFGSWGTCAEEVIGIAGAPSKRLYATHVMSSWYDEGPGLAKMREITLKYYPGTEKPYRGKFYTHGWVMAVVITEGLKNAGRNLDREGFIKAMEDIKNFDTGGVCGPIGYSSTSHKGGNTCRIFNGDPNTGKFIPVTEWMKSE